jgi:hypothetical protein
MAKKIKPKWDKPKLVILVRGKPEEKVLVSCKMQWPGGGGYRSRWGGGCYYPMSNPETGCIACSGGAGYS